MKNFFTVKRITKNALLLAILCVIGMFSIPLGENIKVSFQLLIVFVIGLISTSIIDSLIITSLYLALGFLLPVYAGFNIGISPTFGYVISFIIICFPLYFINKIPKIDPKLRMGIACLISLIISYVVGSIFMMFYLNLDLGSTLLISVVPYVVIDIAKIFMAVLVVCSLPQSVTNIQIKK